MEPLEKTVVLLFFEIVARVRLTRRCLMVERKEFLIYLSSREISSAEIGLVQGGSKKILETRAQTRNIR